MKILLRVLLERTAVSEALKPYSAEIFSKEIAWEENDWAEHKIFLKLRQRQI